MYESSSSRQLFEDHVASKIAQLTEELCFYRDISRAFATYIMDLHYRLVGVGKTLYDLTGQPVELDLPSSMKQLVLVMATEPCDEDQTLSPSIRSMADDFPEITASITKADNLSAMDTFQCSTTVETGHWYSNTPANCCSTITDAGEVEAAATASSASPGQELSLQVHHVGAPKDSTKPGLMTIVSAHEQQMLHHLMEEGRSQHWLIDPLEITLEAKLGSGEFGTTYLASWGEKTVTVKVVQPRVDSELKCFLREVQNMSSLNGPNLVGFLGACLSPPEHLWLVVEYMPGGTLQQWLYRPDTAIVPLVARLEKMRQVARGMCTLQFRSLEGVSVPILHRDLKPENVLLDVDGNAHIGDFGLSRELLAQSQAEVSRETGTYLYMAPEVMRGEEYDSSADVWSFGVMLHEVITRSRPYSYLEEISFSLSPAQIALAVSGEELLLPVPTGIPVELEELLAGVLNWSRWDRPDFYTIYTTLGEIIESLET
ncbi:hypothetical protein VaNZ11_007363 [Volvox africanus]|uniref:Protein kinase domain-containing protein n=1 Tax=Volvox africanus TaxID=51714 RepID=A0ABQ5S2Q5_9CHLO|nr:hypothetical protein VaNZ11_007363 [Volvox africanus]